MKSKFERLGKIFITIMIIFFFIWFGGFFVGAGKLTWWPELFITVEAAIGIIFLIISLTAETFNKNIEKTMTEKTVKIKCNCGNRFKVTKKDAYEIDWDFSGPDYYKFKCPKCGHTHFVSNFNL